jgi:hypothetical protein
MSSLCHDDFIMTNDSVMEISHPPYSVKNFEKDWTAKVNAVPLDVFRDYFVQLLEMCEKWFYIQGDCCEKNKTIFFWLYVCAHSINPGTVLFDHIL